MNRTSRPMLVFKMHMYEMRSFFFHHLNYFSRACAQRFKYLWISHITDHSTVRCNHFCVYVFLPQLIQCLIMNAHCLWKKLALFGTVSVSSSSCFRGESSSVFISCTYQQIFKHQRDKPLSKFAPCWTHQKGQFFNAFHSKSGVRNSYFIYQTYNPSLLLTDSLKMMYKETK